MRRIMPFLATVALTVFSVTNTNAMIIDGQQAKLGEYPAVFGIRMNKSDSFSVGGDFEADCTGFLVAPDLLLTAAHCLIHTNSLALIANGPNLNQRKTKGTVAASDGFKAHPEFSEAHSGMSQAERRKNAGIDIGYITLRHALTDITPLPIYVTTDVASKKILVNLEALLVGYGPTRFLGINADYTSSPRLEKYFGKKVITENEQNYITLNGKENGALPGDSGGPEIVNFDGVAKAVAINHGMNGKKKIITRVIKRGPRKGEIETKTEVDPMEYGFTIGTLLTKENLCWVESESKVKIPGVNCASK